MECGGGYRYYGVSRNASSSLPRLTKTWAGKEKDGWKVSGDRLELGALSAGELKVSNPAGLTVLVMFIDIQARKQN